ncbi:MAG: FecR domain-containing protein [Nitrospirae bacterium]|nr:FecR domain-containing protein [Nitrospirota bacterium]
MIQSGRFKSIGSKFLIILGILVFLPVTTRAAEELLSGSDDVVRLARISYISGELLFQRGDDDNWISTSVNMPLRPHDKIGTSDGARAEIEIDNGSIIRIAENTQIAFLNLEQDMTQIQLTAGLATVMTRLAPSMSESGAAMEIDTPEAAIIVEQRAIFRLEVREDGSTEITVQDGKIRLSTDAEPVWITKGQRIVIDSDENPRYSLESLNQSDEWDEWNRHRDRQILSSVSPKYLPPEYRMGVSELDQYGIWIQDTSYGWVWAPQVPGGWIPYRNGRWVWIEPWGWTWVSYEPWGWVPFHYGRWINNSGRWIWVPGHRREAWSPGHVRFIRGSDWVGWIPLAPGELHDNRSGRGRSVNRDLINYRTPGATTILPRNTFVSGTPIPKRFSPPRDPIKEGRLISGQLPIIPTELSLRPKPEERLRSPLPPSRIVHRPVTYDHPILNPPQRFENRIRDLKETIEKGDSPDSLPFKREENRSPKPTFEPRRERLHKDLVVRTPIKELEEPLQAPRRPPPPPFKHFEQRNERRGKPPEVKSLYRKPPRPVKEREIK